MSTFDLKNNCNQIILLSFLSSHMADSSFPPTQTTDHKAPISPFSGPSLSHTPSPPTAPLRPPLPLPQLYLPIISLNMPAMEDHIIITPDMAASRSP
jgi:hypothetical protein